MKIFHYQSVEAKDADEGAKGVKVQWLITKEIGAPSFAMRRFQIVPNGNSPLHTHPWEHEVFVLEGKGTVVGKDKETEIRPGSVIFIAPNELHQFKNNSNSILVFLCIVPIRDK
jgi:quercetin dioxygenase-like cupin family protein